MKRFAANMEAVTLSDSDVRRTDVHFDPDALREPRAGHISVIVRNQSSGRTRRLLNDPTGLSIGELRSEDPGTGTVYGYQMGAVFRGTGNSTLLISTPQIRATNGSLAIPVVQMAGVERIGSSEIVLRTERTVSLRQTALGPNESVTVTVYSEWYVGWARFFRELAAKRNGETDRAVAAVSVNHANEAATLTVNQTGLNVTTTLYTVSLSAAESE